MRHIQRTENERWISRLRTKREGEREGGREGGMGSKTTNVRWWVGGNEAIPHFQRADSEQWELTFKRHGNNAERPL